MLYINKDIDDHTLMGILRVLLFCLLFAPTMVFARPVSWPGGYTVMQKNDVFRSRLHLHYSPDAFNSYGVVYENRHGTDTEQIGLQWNRLLKRRNTRFSQANLYLKSQVGHVQGGSERDALTAVGLAGDWETRRYFTSYDGRYVDGGKVFDGRLEHRARVGIAPYVAEYGSLHTWLMLQVEHRPESNNEVTITTLARFFHANYLVEVGITDNQDALFNWILRF